MNAEQKYGKDLGERHDRIAGTIESIAERLLHRHQNGELTLGVKDLSSISGIIKATQEIRRVSRNENADKSEKNVNVNFNFPAAVERIAEALVDVDHRPQPKRIASKQIAVEIGDAVGTDDEFDE